MKTLKAISLIVLFSAATATSAQALVQYPQSWYSGPCVNLSRNLSAGARGSDVSQLQTFLVAQDFPGSGSWMETGSFGAASTAAVKDFQQEEGLPTTGIADYQTRAAISRISCGGALAYGTNTGGTYTPTYPNLTASPVPAAIPLNGNGYNGYNNNPSTAYPYPYGNNNYGNGYVSLNLTSLSQNTGAVGTQVTVYGTGFDPSNNTINFGSVALTGVPSNGASMTFIVPAYTLSGSVNITVTDSRGTSNALSFDVSSYGYACGSNYFYAYGSCGCNNQYNNQYGNQYNTYPYGSSNYNNYDNNYGNCGTGSSYPAGNVAAPTATYLNPVSGGVGTPVTIFGTGFTSSGNSVHFGNGIIANLSSNDGRTISFTVPSLLTGFGTANTGLGLYNVSVTNGDGFSTGELPFTVTSLNNNGSGSVSITSVNGPASIGVGTVGTWTITVNNPGNSSFTVTPNWGDANIYPYNGTSQPQTTSAQGIVTLTFTHIYSTSGTYAISFAASNANGTQTSASASVVVNGSSTYGTPTISYLSPNTGNIGTQVTIYGTNFSGNNTVMFGNGAIQNVYSSSASTIVFTVPSSVGPYCAPGTACPQYLQLVMPGTYNIDVMGTNGTSNSVPFTVQ